MLPYQEITESVRTACAGLPSLMWHIFPCFGHSECSLVLLKHGCQWSSCVLPASIISNPMGQRLRSFQCSTRRVCWLLGGPACHEGLIHTIGAGLPLPLLSISKASFHPVQDSVVVSSLVISKPRCSGQKGLEFSPPTDNWYTVLCSTFFLQDM